MTKSNKKIVIIDYGSGNLKSVFNAFNKVKSANHEVKISSDYKDLRDASHIILPGVGAFKDCADGLRSNSLMVDELRSQIESGKNFLGICVGMQLLADIGYEDEATSGLGIVAGEVKRLSDDSGEIKIPHVGWNNIEILQPHRVLSGIENQAHVYFVHSYYFSLKNKQNMIASCDYGSNQIPAIIAKDNVVATQFHPEKSSDVGLKLLRNFINL